MSISTNNWLKKIFSVGSISLVVAIISLFVAYKTLLVDAGGELKIGFPAGDPANGVFEVEALTAEDIDSKLPGFSNPSKYVVKDFYLSYTFSGEDLKIEPSGFFEEVRSRGKTTLTYRPEKLAAGMTVEEPLMALSCGGTEMTVDIDASFNGGSEPFKKSLTFRLADKKPVSTSVATPAPTKKPAPAATTTTVVEKPADKVIETSETEKTDSETVIVKSKKEQGPSLWTVLIMILCIFVAIIAFICTFCLYESAKEVLQRKLPFWQNIRSAFHRNFDSSSSPSALERFGESVAWYLAWLGLVGLVAVVIFFISALVRLFC